MDDFELELSEIHSERMCELCELHVLGCSRNTIHYQCEGSRCDEAIEYLKEDLGLDEYEKLFPIY